jgi:hypothetical protein
MIARGFAMEIKPIAKPLVVKTQAKSMRLIQVGARQLR